VTVIPQDAPRSDDGQWWWDGTQWQPTTAIATPDSPPPVEETGDLPRMRRSEQGWLLTLKATDASAVERTLWPNGTPPGVSVAVHSVNEQDQVGTFLIVGLTSAASQTMERSWANWMAQTQMFPEEPASTGQQPEPQPQPSVAADGAMTPEESESAWTTFFNEGVHTVLEFASWFAKEGGEFATVYEGFAGPMGYAMMLYDLFSNTIEAFQEEMRGQKRNGFLFGLVWQVIGMSDVAPTMMDELAPTPDMFSFEEHAAAFNDGVKEGRSRGESDAVLHNSIAARIAYRMVREHSAENWAAQETLTELAASAGVTDYRQLVIGAPQVQ
jgi:hypothetical protein